MHKKDNPHGTKLDFSFFVRGVVWIPHALIFVTTILIFVPFFPVMPVESLESWAFGMNEVVAKGLAIGQDIIFTVGPYSSIYTKTYHPATDHLMIVGSLFLGVSYGSVLLLISRGDKWCLLIPVWVVLAGLMLAREPLFFSYPLMVAVYCFKLINLKLDIRPGDHKSILLTSALFLPFGLLPLVKGDSLILCIAIAGLALLLFTDTKNWRLAIAVVVSPVVSLVFFWIISGQAIPDLALYVISMTPIISGYSEAMSLSGVGKEVIFYLVSATVLLTILLCEDNSSLKGRLFLSLAFFVYLFVAFKGGFVRHDPHAMIAGTSLLLASVLLPFVSYSQHVLLFMLFAIFAWIYIDSHYFKTSTETVISNIKSTYSSSWEGIKIRWLGGEKLRSDFSETLKHLAEKADFPLLNGTTDIYSYNQSYLLSSGNVWNPRPVFQSYSVYTPSLVSKNKQHLLGKNAPDNIIFRVEPIDGRIASIEDGASWPALLSLYQPTALKNDFLFLKKSHVPGKTETEFTVGQGSYTFGDLVSLPENGDLFFTEIAIKPSFLGRLISILYKPSQLKITVNLAGGTAKSYRLIAGMTSSGFLLSPLIESTTEFGLLYGRTAYLSHKKVKSFSIAPVGGKWQWRDGYEVVFKKLTLPSDPAVSSLYKFERVLDASIQHSVDFASECDGSIDSINGASPAASEFTASALLGVHGWLATSIEAGLPAEKVLLVLTSKDNNKIFIETRQTYRPDVGAYFKKPCLDSSGYAATADVSHIVGRYTLGLAFIEGSHIKICPQFQVLGTFNGMTHK